MITAEKMRDAVYGDTEKLNTREMIEFLIWRKSMRGVTTIRLIEGIRVSDDILNELDSKGYKLLLDKDGNLVEIGW